MARITRYQGAIIRDHHILLIKQIEHASGRSYWLLPGGGIEPDETEERCVQREMQEETGLHVHVQSLLLDEPGSPGGVYQRRKTYVCQVLDGEARPGYEPEEEYATAYSFTEVGWFDLRHPTSWNEQIVSDPITYPLLQRIQAALGYAVAGDTMIDDVSDIAAFYNSDPEREHRRLEQHQLEYDLTWRYLDQYLPSQGSILEVGAATGRYTLELAKRGYTLTAVDLSAELIEGCRKSLADEGLERRVRYVVADARDLSEVAERGFDAVLLMGPLYHLIVEADRKMALKEAFDRLREGGILFSSFLSRFGVMGDLLRNVPGWIENQAEVRSLLERGKRPDDFPRGGFRGYFAQISEITPLLEAVGFETLTVVGVEPAISADDESYNKLQGKQRQLWLDLLYEMSAERSIIGASRHLLYIGKKK